MSFGFKPRNIFIIPEGITLKPLAKLADNKYTAPTMLSLGHIRPMKQTLDIIKAFEIAKPKLPELQLKVAGEANSPYGKKVL